MAYVKRAVGSCRAGINTVYHILDVHDNVDVSTLSRVMTYVKWRLEAVVLFYYVAWRARCRYFTVYLARTIVLTYNDK
ncbi:hypothetical protein BRADI_2g25345v3 [Brachypodium distachyon]|uniref:Uncharacterized protein n=1 Tax=Brachypodium distachyon TaxID=15368 RepID=A0A2K2DAF2_BRADI|nr:hypothetical protein BRADI_2g25345v3 [Brachypodium distachyon]